MGILRSRKHYLPYRIANGLFDQVQAVSERVREFCIYRDHLPPQKVVTVPNGIDLDAIDRMMPGEKRMLLPLDHDSPVVTTVANIRFIKGIDILVKAAAYVRERIPDAKFVLIGAALQEPRYEDQVRSAVGRLGLQNNIRFLGLRRDVISLLKQSDVFCLPSRSEGMSNALLEAMACRVPCVATDVGGNSEVVIEGQTGFLVPSEDPQALAVRIVTLLSDRERAKCMGEKGRSIIESKFTVQHMVERLSFLYEALLKERGLTSAMPDSISDHELPNREHEIEALATKVGPSL